MGRGEREREDKNRLNCHTQIESVLKGFLLNPVAKLTKLSCGRHRRLRGGQMLLMVKLPAGSQRPREGYTRSYTNTQAGGHRGRRFSHFVFMYGEMRHQTLIMIHRDIGASAP